MVWHYELRISSSLEQLVSNADRGKTNLKCRVKVRHTRLLDRVVAKQVTDASIYKVSLSFIPTPTFYFLAMLLAPSSLSLNDVAPLPSGPQNSLARFISLRG